MIWHHFWFYPGGSVPPYDEVEIPCLSLRKGSLSKFSLGFPRQNILFSLAYPYKWYKAHNCTKILSCDVHYLYIKTTKFEIFVSKILSSSEEAPSKIRFFHFRYVFQWYISVGKSIVQLIYISKWLMLLSS